MRPGNTEQHARARLIVCERTGKWAVALRRSRQIGSFRVYETRSPEECRDEVEASPASLVAMEASTANFDEILDWLTEMRRGFPRCRVVILGCRGLKRGQWLLREAGAVHVVDSPRKVGAVVRIASRQLKNAGNEDRLIREQILGRMPW